MSYEEIKAELLEIAEALSESIVEPSIEELDFN